MLLPSSNLVELIFSSFDLSDEFLKTPQVSTGKKKLSMQRKNKSLYLTFEFHPCYSGEQNKDFHKFCPHDTLTILYTCIISYA